MENLLYKRLVAVLYLFIGIIIISGMIYSNTVIADDKLDKSDKQNGEILINADQIIYDGNTLLATCTGNVRAVYDNAVITSGKMEITLRKGLREKEDISENESSIKKIVFKENVNIKFEDGVAVTEHAVYTTIDKIFVLKGENSKVISEKNYVTGCEIIWNRNDERVTVKSCDKKPAEAVFSSKGEK
ncbi:MAG: hypothetical protein HN737_07160 [Desulfobacterales bacterium]|jgi:lipopolysaccharide transport protein LptA|nr:hypothetical protein [Desulfobacteraceae bacterium]MBT4363456.1 hypothetical protein [Desulfobacteraceae bacterium]MBT7086294.1 hypothetical protein [Desulfobacterales bacterium]MBT7697173.1 hypothetical protein [Desulfobacterales bacterium]